MSDKRDFDFCPRCGALMQNGVCQSCGRGSTRSPQTSDSYYMKNPQNQAQTQGNPGMQGGPGVAGGPGTSPSYVYAAPVKQKNHTAAVVISVTAVVIIILGLVIALVAALANSARENIRSGQDRSGRDSYDDFYDDYYGGYDDDYDYGYYEPDEDDPYYKEIVDCTRTDLDYGIQWVVESVDPDNSEDECTYYTTYPILEKDNSDAFNTVNEKIRQKAAAYRPSYKDYEGGVSTFGYVTLMDEEKISIVFKHNYYKEDVTEVRLEALTFRIDTGEEITSEEMTEIDLDLAMRFQAQDKLQNEGVEYVQKLTGEELLEILKDPGQAVFFYTPVGLEAGFNYESGWVTVTLKEQAL